MSRLQPCLSCGSLSFEEENGIIVCTSCGRQQESGLQVADEEPEFGTQGKVSRKKVERTKVKVTKIARGAQAYRLYLQAWQYILWRQAHALIHGPTQVPAEMWTVVKDLWALRLSRLVQRLDQLGKASDLSEDQTNQAASDRGGEDTSDEEERRSSLTPRLWDTVSLLYLAALLHRCPITLHQIYQLIRTEEMPFIRAIRFVPSDISSRLPSEYRLALDTVTIPTKSQLHAAIYRMLSIYVTDFGIILPPLNWRLLLYNYIQDLGLPIEVYSVVQRLTTIVNFDFAYHIPVETSTESAGHGRKPRRTPVAMAEVQLMSLIIIATKLVFPFELKGSLSGRIESASLPAYTGHPLFRLDWTSWLHVHKVLRSTNSLSASTLRVGSGKHIEVHDKDVLNLSGAQLDDYMNWYQRTFTIPDSTLRDKKTNLEESILSMFPMAADSDNDQHNETAFGQTDDANKTIKLFQAESIRPAIPVQQVHVLSRDRLPSGIAEDETVPGSKYPILPTIESVTATNILYGGNLQDGSSNPVLYFHEQAAELACVDLGCLLKGVRYTERRLEEWADHQKRDEVSAQTDMREGT